MDRINYGKSGQPVSLSKRALLGLSTRRPLSHIAYALCMRRMWACLHIVVRAQLHLPEILDEMKRLHNPFTSSWLAELIKACAWSSTILKRRRKEICVYMRVTYRCKCCRSMTDIANTTGLLHQLIHGPVNLTDCRTRLALSLSMCRPTSYCKSFLRARQKALLLLAKLCDSC